jgi:hypothetical protein
MQARLLGAQTERFGSRCDRVGAEVGLRIRGGIARRFGRTRFFGALALILLPLAAHARLALGRELLELSKTGTRCATLLRRETHPFLHALLEALLLAAAHLGVALGHAQPFLLALGVELIPFTLNRREDLLLLRGELFPRGILLGGAGGKRRDGDEQPDG